MGEQIQRADVVNSPTRSAQTEAVAWEVALRHRTFGYGELRAEARMGEHHVRAVVKAWVDEGRCERLAPSGKRHRVMFRVLAAWLPKDRASEARSQMWTAMRLLRSFTPMDLVAHAAMPITDREATDYCRALLGAEYLGVIQRATVGVRPATYRLLRNSGPAAPRLRRVIALFDDNIGAVVHISTTAEGGSK